MPRQYRRQGSACDVKNQWPDLETGYAEMNYRTGGQIIVDLLEEYGIRRVFSVPGESFLGVLDALHDSGIRNTVCRHEGGASFMADAHAKLTGLPGVAFVTRGPGASNAACGVHVASHDSTPLILFVGQVKRALRGMEAFQEVDIARVFGPICKWADEIPDQSRISEYVHRAFSVAMTGRRGPVVVALPEDILTLEACSAGSTVQLPSQPDPPDNQIRRFADWLNRARRPMVIVGGSQWSSRAAVLLQQFSARFKVPVATSFRRQDYIDNRCDNYVGVLAAGGNPMLNKQVAACDRLLLLGTRFGDIPSLGFTCPLPGDLAGSIAHVFPQTDEFHRIWKSDLSLCTSPEQFLEAILGCQAEGQPGQRGWMVQCRRLHANWSQVRPVPGAVTLPYALTWLSRNLPENAIVTNGAGNYAAFLHRYYRYKSYPSQLAPTSGSMGYGLPAAIAAKLEHPDRTVVCLAGDGCFQMTLNELSTAVQHAANVVVIVANNGLYGTIRMHQELHYPGRVSGTDVFNPDYSSLARAYGCHGEAVTSDAEFAAAFERSTAAGSPAIIELRLDPDAISSEATMEDLRKVGATPDSMAASLRVQS